MLKEYNVIQDVMTLYCDNMISINIFNNPVQHSHTEHIDIRHHFIREIMEDKIITLDHVSTEKQLTGIFTKTLDATQFEKLRSSLGICIMENLFKLMLRWQDSNWAKIFALQSITSKKCALKLVLTNENAKPSHISISSILHHFSFTLNLHPSLSLCLTLTSSFHLLPSLLTSMVDTRQCTTTSGK